MRTLQDSIENMDHQRAEEGVRQAELARQKKLVDDFHKMPGFVQQKWRDKAAAEQPVLKGLSTLLEQAAAAKAACHSGVPKL